MKKLSNQDNDEPKEDKNFKRETFFIQEKKEGKEKANKIGSESSIKLLEGKEDKKADENQSIKSNEADSSDHPKNDHEEKGPEINLDLISTDHTRYLNKRLYILPEPLPKARTIDPKNQKKLKTSKLIKHALYYKTYTSYYFEEVKKKVEHTKKYLRIFSVNNLLTLDPIYLQIIQNELSLSEKVSRSEFILNLEGAFEVEDENDSWIVFVYEPCNGSVIGGMDYYWSRVRGYQATAKQIEEQGADFKPAITLDPELAKAVAKLGIALIEIRELGYCFTDLDKARLTFNSKNLPKLYDVSNCVKIGEKNLTCDVSRFSPPELRWKRPVEGNTMTWIFFELLLLIMFKQMFLVRSEEEKRKQIKFIQKNYLVSDRFLEVFDGVFHLYPGKRVSLEEVLKLDIIKSHIKDDNNFLRLIPLYILEGLEIEADLKRKQGKQEAVFRKKRGKFQGKKLDVGPRRKVDVRRMAEELDYDKVMRARSAGKRSVRKQDQGSGDDFEGEKKESQEHLGLFDKILEYFGCFSDT